MEILVADEQLLQQIVYLIWLIAFVGPSDSLKTSPLSCSCHEIEHGAVPTLCMAAPEYEAGPLHCQMRLMKAHKNFPKQQYLQKFVRDSADMHCRVYSKHSDNSGVKPPFAGGA
jgi:hypothetical protein